MFEQTKAMFDLSSCAPYTPLLRPVNSPFIFRAAWAIAKLWLHPVTKEKVQLFGSDYQKELHEMIGARCVLNARP